MIFKRKPKQPGGTAVTAPPPVNYGGTCNNSEPLQQLSSNVQNIPSGSSWRPQALRPFPLPSYPSSQPYLPLQAPPLRYGNTPHDSKWRSCTNLPTAITAPVQLIDDGIGEWQHKTTGYLNQGAAVCDLVSNKLNAVITSIDGERFSGDERELGMLLSFLIL